jgi:pimeloyl-ACP methyl ester carboxylesterase
MRPADRLYPFSSHFLETRGLRLHYLDEGPRDGPPVLMLHGNPTWSFYYRNLVLALRGQYRCIVPDHIGCGLSDKPGDESYDYRLRSRIEDLDTLLGTLDLRQPLTLVGHDWGGMIGFAWAVRNPDRIARCVVLNTAAFPMPDRALRRPEHGGVPDAEKQKDAAGPEPRSGHGTWRFAGAALQCVRRNRLPGSLQETRVARGPQGLHDALRHAGQPHRNAAVRPGHPAQSRRSGF